MRRTFLSACVVCVILTTPLIYAQDEEIRAIRIRRSSTALSALAENRWALSDTTYRFGQYTENVDLAFDGSIYHPNFMSYNLALQLGLVQLVDPSSETGATSPMVTADVHLLTTWLREKLFSMSLYADHGEDYQDLDMFDGARITETVVGGLGQWSSAFAPIVFSVRNSSIQETRTDWSSAAEEFVITGGLNRTSPGGGTDTTLEYTFSDFDRRIVDVSGQTGRSHDFRFANNLGFGLDGDHQLSTNLNLLNMAGTVDLRIIDFSQTFDLEHQFNLTSRYFYALYMTGPGNTPAVTNRCRAELTHQLYESLTTTLSGEARMMTSEQGSNWSAGPSLALSYRKEIGIGTLHIGYGVKTDAESRTVLTPTLQVFGERHVLSDTAVTLLDNTGVDLSSVVVADGSGATVYARIIDYELEQIGSRTRIARVPDGNIAEGSEVLVDYLTMDGQSTDLLNIDQRVESRVMLFDDRLAVYIRYLRERRPQEAAASGESLDRLLSGFTVELRPVAVTGEFEHYGSVLSPYNMYRLQQSFSLPMSRGSSLSLKSSGMFIRFRETNELSGNLDFEAEYDTPIGRYATLSAGGGYRFESDGSTAPLSRWAGKVVAEYIRGQLTCSLIYDLKVARSPEMGQDHTLRFLARKEF